MNFKVIIPILIYILLVIIAITVVILFFYYKPFDIFFKKNNTYNKIEANIDKLYIKEQKKEEQVAEPKDTTSDSKLTKNAPLEEKKFKSEGYKNQTDTQKKYQKEEQLLKKISDTGKTQEVLNKQQVTKKNSIPTKETYAKGSSLPDQSFDSYGEYISPEEYYYRLTLIKNLNIKTVIIDDLTKGNGISQEFFKVVYMDKMIPSKILEEIVESKEFRNLIPAKFRKEEIKTKGLVKGESVTFKNQSIKNLLILWIHGRLTPIQKAWKVKAEK